MATATLTKLKNFIDGESVDAADGATEPVLNPATGEAFAEAPLSTEEDINRAVAAAKAAFPAWSTTTPDAGKPRSAFRDDEIPFMVDNLRFFAGAARCMEGKAAGEYVEGYTSMIRREAVGVVGQITPWNYPLMMAIWKIGPALAAGCTTVVKPAETTPVSTLRLAELAAEHLPKGVFNVVAGHGEPAGAPLVKHPDVDRSP
jgi:betaine-aldehyde dehydrogenase